MSADHGEHRVVRELARGGMGVLYEVEHRRTGARRALKTLLLGAHDPVERARFRREAELLARLDHPAIVRIHEAVVDGPAPYLVQDLLPGGSLEARLAKGPLPCAEARAIAAALARGVEHAHARGVLHRDLKPKNVVFDDQGRPRLVDFGLARRVDGGSLTTTGAILGTPGYLPPEQALGLPADERSDVYGLGAVLYAMLVGRPPHDGESLVAVLAAIVEGRLDAPRAHRPEIPADLEAICLRALATDPAARYPSAGALAAALEAQAPPPLAPPRARLARGGLAAGVALLGLAGAAALLTRGGSAPPPAAPPSPAVAPAAEPPDPGAARWDREAAARALARCDAGAAVAALTTVLGPPLGRPPVDPERGELELLARAIDGPDLPESALGRPAARLVRALVPIEEAARRHEAVADRDVVRDLDLVEPLPLEAAEPAWAALRDFVQEGAGRPGVWREALRRRGQRLLGRALAAQGLSGGERLRAELRTWCQARVDPLGPERSHTDVLWAFRKEWTRRPDVLARLRPLDDLASIHRQAADVVLLVGREPIFDAAAGDALLRRLENYVLDHGAWVLLAKREVGRLHRLEAFALRRRLPPGARDPEEVIRHLVIARELCSSSGDHGAGQSGEETLLCHLAAHELGEAEALLERLTLVEPATRVLLRAELLLARRQGEQARDLLQGLPDGPQERRVQLAHALKLAGDPAWAAPLAGAEALVPWGIEWRALDVARDVAEDRVWWPGRWP